jgi:hypothetical protein
VFAIIITLLVLDIHLPELAERARLSLTMIKHPALPRPARRLPVVTPARAGYFL